MNRLFAGLVLAAALAAAGCGSGSPTKPAGDPPPGPTQPLKDKDGKPVTGPIPM
jgi:hypothetical protein